MDGCIANTHWKACQTCRNHDLDYGCVIKESIPLSLYNGDYIICGDYEKRTKHADWCIGTEKGPCNCGVAEKQK